MDERIMQFRVGVMVLATLIVTAILLVMFGKLPTLIGRNTTIYDPLWLRPRRDRGHARPQERHPYRPGEQRRS